MAQADNDSFNASRCVNWAQLFIAEFGCFSYHSHTHRHTLFIFIFVHIHIQLVGPSLGSTFDSLQGHKIVTIWPHWPRIPSSYQHIARYLSIYTHTPTHIQTHTCTGIRRVLAGFSWAGCLALPAPYQRICAGDMDDKICLVCVDCMSACVCVCEGVWPTPEDNKAILWTV